METVAEREKYFSIERTLLNMIKAARHSGRLDSLFSGEDYTNSPYGKIFDEIADAVFFLVGESVNQFEDSLTYIVLHTDAITDEEKTRILLNKYKETHP